MSLRFSKIDPEKPFDHLPEEFIEEPQRPCKEKTVYNRTCMPVTRFMPKTDSGFWLSPQIIFQKEFPKGIVTLFPPGRGWLHQWCHTFQGVSCVYPLRDCWSVMFSNQLEEVVPDILDSIQKLWTPANEICIRKKEYKQAFQIAKAKKST